MKNIMKNIKINSKNKKIFNNNYDNKNSIINKNDKDNKNKNIINKNNKILIITFTLFLGFIFISNIKNIYASNYEIIDLKLKDNNLNIFYDNFYNCTNESIYCENDSHILLNYSDMFIELYDLNDSIINKFFSLNETIIHKNIENLNKIKIYVLNKTDIINELEINKNDFLNNKKLSEICYIYRIKDSICDDILNELNIENINISFPLFLDIIIINENISKFINNYNNNNTFYFNNNFNISNNISFFYKINIEKNLKYFQNNLNLTNFTIANFLDNFLINYKKINLTNNNNNYINNDDINNNDNSNNNSNNDDNSNNNIIFTKDDEIIFNRRIINLDFPINLILENINYPIFKGENFTFNNLFLETYNFSINFLKDITNITENSYININSYNLNDFLISPNYEILIEKRNKIIENDLFDSNIKNELENMIDFFLEN
ncbi:MAG: hypothetical protein PHT94_03740 [Candidatus Nanoarchaeia archaeon]|nr:hypothetical protein [Candidatus Nanoarchaeia archaeon]